MKRLLTIAGSDSGGGAGIQADLKTFSAHGHFGMSAITAVTAQNTVGVSGVEELPPALIAAQIDAVVSDIGVDGVKTGMVSQVTAIEVIVDRVRFHNIETLVVDPVMVTKGGHPLLRPEAEWVLIERLLPLALIATPNIYEAEKILGRPITSLREAADAARRIGERGVRNVLVKGGGLGNTAVDLLWNGSEVIEIDGERIESRHTHGTGCTLSAAIACNLADGFGVEEGVRKAKQYVAEAIRRGPPFGNGVRPVHHFWEFEGEK